MPRRRPRYHSPDGLDWRDPDMPVVRKIRSGEVRLMEPERVAKVADYMINGSNAPSFHNDPTYNLRRRK